MNFAWRCLAHRHQTLLSLIVAMSLTPTTHAGSNYHSPHTNKPIHFQMSVIDAHASGSYGLIGHDITGNGYTDLVSFAYTGTTAGLPEGEIYWYEFVPAKKANAAPTWKKHLITKKKHVVQGAFMDVSGKGYEDLVFMSDFEVPIKNEDQEGNIWWAKRPTNLNVPAWDTFWIGRVPGAHRVMTADLTGDGHKQVIVIPLFGKGERPIYGPAHISLFEPNDDVTLPWKKTVFSDLDLHAAHDVIVLPKQRPGDSEKLLVAAKEGVVKIFFDRDTAGVWHVIPQVLHSTPADKEIDLTARDQGTTVLNKQQNANLALSGVTVLSPFNPHAPFIAAIDYTTHSGYLEDEPWHGDTVSIYKPKQNRISSRRRGGEALLHAQALERIVLEKRSAGGHAVQVADFRGIGCQDVVAGFRAYPTAFMIYLCKQTKTKNGKLKTHYEKQIISERAANAIVIGNWNKHGLPDLATAGYGTEGDPYILMWSNKTKKK